MAEVKSFSRAAPSEKHPPGVQKKPYQSAPAAPTMRAPAKGKSVVDARPCLFHNPKMGMTCEKQKLGQCMFQHLNTNDPSQLKLFTDHQTTYKAGGKGRGKGRGQTKGRGK